MGPRGHKANDRCVVRQTERHHQEVDLRRPAYGCQPTQGNGPGLLGGWVGLVQVPTGAARAAMGSH